MPANRIATLTAVLGAIGAFLATLLGAFENEYVRGAVAVAALGLGGVVVWKFLEGSQNFDALQIAGVPKNTQVVAPPNPPGELTNTLQYAGQAGEDTRDREVEYLGEVDANDRLAGFGGDESYEPPEPESREGTASAG